jgi:hypothetical protein
MRKRVWELSSEFVRKQFELIMEHQMTPDELTEVLKRYCATPRFFVGTGQIQRRIISWELARGVRGKLTREEL